MKKSKFLAVVAFIAAVASVFAFTPPPTAYGKHTTLGCVTGSIDFDTCDIQAGIQCKVSVGSGSGAQSKDAFSDLSGCNTSDDSKRLRRPNP